MSEFFFKAKDTEMSQKEVYEVRLCAAPRAIKKKKKKNSPRSPHRVVRPRALLVEIAVRV